MPLTTESVVRPANQLSIDHIDDLYNNAREALYSSHVRAMGGEGNYVIRQLLPSDLNESNEVWAETVTASGSSYQNSQIAGQTIPDDTSVCLYGLIDTSDPQPITQVRITSGQGVRAIWDLFPIIGSDLTVSGDITHRTMYAMTPVIITRNINVKIEYYVRAFSPQVIRGAEIAIIGLVCENAGLNIQP
jgi:hypothetical protein